MDKREILYVLQHPGDVFRFQDSKKYSFFGVSTDCWFLVVKIEVSENALNKKKALYKESIRLPMD